MRDWEIENENEKENEIKNENENENKNEIENENENKNETIPRLISTCNAVLLRLQHYDLINRTQITFYTSLLHGFFGERLQIRQSAVIHQNKDLTLY